MRTPFLLSDPEVPPRDYCHRQFSFCTAALTVALLLFKTCWTVPIEPNVLFYSQWLVVLDPWFWGRICQTERRDGTFTSLTATSVHEYSPPAYRIRRSGSTAEHPLAVRWTSSHCALRSPAARIKTTPSLEGRNSRSTGPSRKRFGHGRISADLSESSASCTVRFSPWVERRQDQKRNKAKDPDRLSNMPDTPNQGRYEDFVRLVYPRAVYSQLLILPRIQ